MADRPIIFSAPMIQALLAGRKTQTRRLTKKQDWIASILKLHPRQRAGVPCLPGDRLWVRENVRVEELPNGHDGVRYPADNAWLPIENTTAAADRWSELFYYGGERGKGGLGRQAPSIHMPRWASRLTLTVTDVRVERLNDISEEDAAAEGLIRLRSGRYGVHKGEQYAGLAQHTARARFADLWASIHGPEAWAANPWVAAISFRVHRAKIDALPADALDIAGAA